jgi:hypothetical protein
MDVTKLTKDLNDDDLAALADGVQAEARNRRPKVTMDDIKPGMSKEKSAEIWGELGRLVKGLTGGR